MAHRASLGLAHGGWPCANVRRKHSSHSCPQSYTCTATRKQNDITLTYHTKSSHHTRVPRACCHLRARIHLFTHNTTNTITSPSVHTAYKVGLTDRKRYTAQIISTTPAWLFCQTAAMQLPVTPPAAPTPHVLKRRLQTLSPTRWGSRPHALGCSGCGGGLFESNTTFTSKVVFSRSTWIRRVSPT